MYEYVIMKISKAKQTRIDNKKRRSNQSCKVYSLKLDKSKLSKKTKAKLDMIFLEGKWLYNYILSMGDPFSFDTKTKEVDVLVKDKIEKRILANISGAMKQGIQGRMVQNIQNLSKAKKTGRKVGRLKYKSKFTSIPLKQYSKTSGSGTHRIVGKSHIQIQGIKQKLRANGIGQIPEGVEYANANLVKIADDYYLKLTTFQDKVKVAIPNKAIGIDFGCETQMTFSDGTKVKFQIPASKRIKRLDQRIMKKKNGKFRSDSKKKRQDQIKRQKEYNKLNNKKKDIRNKIVSALTKNFRTIIFQNENIHAWMASGKGKSIQNSGIGGIIADLKNKSHTPIMVDKFFPSTKLCPKCGCLKKIPLSERVYSCDCGFIMDRDIKSARCILAEGLRINKIPVDSRDSKAGEILPSAFADILSKIDCVSVSKAKSVNQESPV